MLVMYLKEQLGVSGTSVTYLTGIHLESQREQQTLMKRMIQ